MLARTGTNWLKSILWWSFGPVKSYTQENVDSGGRKMTFSDTRNKAYRTTDRAANVSTTNYMKLAYGEDARGRYVKKEMPCPATMLAADMDYCEPGW